jgi:hypothetical protein
MNKRLYNILLIAGVVAAGHFMAFEICHIPTQLELAAILGIALIYPILRFPLVGIYAIFLICPFIPFVRRLYYLVYGRPAIDPLIVIGDIIALLVFSGLFFELRSKNLPKTYMHVIGLYIVYMIFRTFVFNISPVTASIVKLENYAPAVFLFFAGAIFSRRIDHLKRLWVITIIIGFFTCIYGFKQLYTGYSDAERLWFSSIKFTTLFIKGIARPFSFFQAPAVFADYLILSMIAVLMFLSWSKFKGKIFLYLLIPLFFYGILITSVRSNWIGAIAILFFWFVAFQIKRAHHRTATVIIVVLFLLACQFAADSLKNDTNMNSFKDIVGDKFGKQEYVNLMVTSRAKAIINPFEEHSLVSRVALWKYMFTLSANPEMALLGRGLGTLNADSLYVTYLSEFGYPGLIFICGIFLAFIFNGLKKMNKLSDPAATILVNGIVCMDISLALMNLTGTHIHSFPGDVYFWFWNGVLVNLSAVDKSTSQENINP